MKQLKETINIEISSKTFLNLLNTKNPTFGLRYKLSLQRKIDKHVLCHESGAVVAANDAIKGGIVKSDII